MSLRASIIRLDVLTPSRRGSGPGKDRGAEPAGSRQQGCPGGGLRHRSARQFPGSEQE
jgi:hypothetical protein